jgi:hypothetical protein
MLTAVQVQYMFIFDVAHHKLSSEIGSIKPHVVW